MQLNPTRMDPRIAKSTYNISQSAGRKLLYYMQFLEASTHLYKRLCPSVRRSFALLDLWSVGEHESYVVKTPGKM